MGRVQTFDHTADVGFHVEGESLDDLFTTAAEALIDYIVVSRAAVLPIASESVNLKADDLAELLVAWLNELIFRCETQHRVYGRVEARVDASRCQLEATIEGEPIDRSRHILDHEVKAVTRHDAKVWKTDGGWNARVILDI
jgi:SHS2 domain-containing protein